MVQRSDFSLAEVQGASGLALDPCVLFSVWLLVGCLVSGLAVAGVGSCGCLLPAALFWSGRSAVGWLVGCLVGELAVVERVLCLFGSCGLAAGVHALGSRLGPPLIEVWRDLDVVIIDGWFSSLGCSLELA